MAKRQQDVGIGSTDKAIDAPGGLRVNGTEIITPAGAVTADIQATAGSIGTTELADGAVTPAKMINVEAITATADGLTTGIVSAGISHITVTSASADNIVTLPTPVVGQVITGYVSANGCELRGATAGDTVNGVDVGATNEAAIPATTFIRLTGISTTDWILEATSELGVAIAGIVPDAV